MFRKQDIIALLGVGVVAAWPMASEAITCSSGLAHKRTGTGGSAFHSCIGATTGSVLAQVLTVNAPGTVILRINPCTAGSEECGGGTTTSTTSTSQPEALLLCKKGTMGKVVPIPATFDELANTASCTTTHEFDSGQCDEDSRINFRTTLKVKPTAAQLLSLKPFCPRGSEPTDYVPTRFRGRLEYPNLELQEQLDDTGGICTVNPNIVNFDPNTGGFTVVRYGGGCGPALGKEFPFEEPPPSRHGEPKAKSRSPR